MISIPLYLVDIDVSRPLIWNGAGIELAASSYVELEQKIAAIKQNRVTLSAGVQKIKLDMGQLRKFDLFTLEHNIRLVEKELLRVLPLLNYLQSSAENLDLRVSSYEDLLLLISDLYAKFKEEGAPILQEIEANTGKIYSIKKKIDVLDSVVVSVTAKTNQLQSRLNSTETKTTAVERELNALFNQLNLLSRTNFELFKNQATATNSKSIIDAKIAKNETNLDYLAAKICELNIKFIQLYSELNNIIDVITEVYNLSTFLSGTINTAQISLTKINNNILLLRDFYIEAEAKVRAIENYLTAFIVAGDNTHLDFGLDYTVVHAVPPKMPNCPDPAPCPGSTPVIVTTQAPTATTKKGIDFGRDPGLAPSTKKPAVLPSANWCYPTDNAYLGCYVVFATVSFNRDYGKNISFDGEWSDNEVLRVECYFDAESKLEADYDARVARDTWNDNYAEQFRMIELFNPNPVIPIFRIVEITNPDRCREIFRTDRL